MYTPKVYLETSIISFMYADDAPDKQQDTIKLFEEISEGRYEVYTGYNVIAELSGTKDETLRTKLLSIVKDYEISVFPADDEIQRLADIYVAEGVIPQKYRDDAVHIATAAFYGMDFILSWNFKHIVKRKTILMTGIINAREGYKQIGIHSPSEVIEYDE